jgi:outer membrane immunogenic protein
MLKKGLSAGALIVLLAAVSGAQEAGHFDASAAWGGVFSKSSSAATAVVTDSPTNSGLLLVTLRIHFNRMHAIEFNFARAHNSQVFLLPPDHYRVAASISEYSGAYVFSPFHFEKLDPFLFAGGGALRFVPGNTYIDGFQSTFGAAGQTNMAFLYGGGADYRFWRSLALRLEYRGLIYRAPTFRLPQFFTGAKGHMAEPAIGIVLRF